MEKYNYTQDELNKKKKELYQTLDELTATQKKQSQPYIDAQPKMLEMKETNNRSDDDIMDEVRKKIEQTYGQKVQKAEEDAQSAQTSLSEKIKKLQESAEEQKNATGARYDEAKKVVEGDAVKRGIARSSIANEGVAALERDKTARINEIDDETTKLTDETQAKIAALGEELKKLIEELGVKKEEDAQTAFKQAVDQKNKSNNEIIDYNNKAVTKNSATQAQYDKSADKAALDNINEEYNLEKVKKVVNFYKSFADKDAAVNDFLADESMKDYLGDRYLLALRMIKV